MKRLATLTLLLAAGSSVQGQVVKPPTDHDYELVIVTPYGSPVELGSESVVRMRRLDGKETVVSRAVLRNRTRKRIETVELRWLAHDPSHRGITDRSEVHTRKRDLKPGKTRVETSGPFDTALGTDHFLVTVVRVTFTDGESWPDSPPEPDEHLARMREAAELGDLEAQYLMGLAYREGWTVPQDDISAHAWFHVSAAYGHAAAAELRDRLATSMTAKELSQANYLARQWARLYFRKAIEGSARP